MLITETSYFTYHQFQYNQCTEPYRLLILKENIYFVFLLNVTFILKRQIFTNYNYIRIYCL